MGARADVREALVRDLPATVEAVVGRIRGEIPAYAALSDGQLAEVSAIASWGLRRVLDLWVADQRLSAADVRRFEGIGAVRALDGRPLPGVLRAYRLAGRSIFEIVTQRAGSDLAVADVLALTELWMATVDGLSEALQTGHARASERVVADRDAALAGLLADLVTGRQATVTALADRSRQLSVRLPTSPVVVVLGPGQPGDRVTATRLGDVLGAAGLAGDESTLRSVREDRGVVLCGPDDLRPLRRAVAASALRGCAVRAGRAADVSRAHQLAGLCLDGAPHHAFDARRVLGEGDAQVVALLAASPLADPAVAAARVLQDLRRPDNVHLLDGLDAFLATGAATSAADRLGLHPQTMRYRLRRIEQLTGRDPRRPWDRFVLEAARRAHRQERPTVTDGGRPGPGGPVTGWSIP